MGLIETVASEADQAYSHAVSAASRTRHQTFRDTVFRLGITRDFTYETADLDLAFIHHAGTEAFYSGNYVPLATFAESLKSTLGSGEHVPVLLGGYVLDQTSGNGISERRQTSLSIVETNYNFFSIVNKKEDKLVRRKDGATFPLIERQLGIKAMTATIAGDIALVDRDLHGLETPEVVVDDVLPLSIRREAAEVASDEELFDATTHERFRPCNLNRLVSDYGRGKILLIGWRQIGEVIFKMALELRQTGEVENWEVAPGLQRQTYLAALGEALELGSRDQEQVDRIGERLANFIAY